MKKYHTGEVIIAVFILFMLWGGWKLSADVTYMDGYESYGFFRYQAYLSTYQDKKAAPAKQEDADEYYKSLAPITTFEIAYDTGKIMEVKD